MPATNLSTVEGDGLVEGTKTTGYKFISHSEPVPFINRLSQRLSDTSSGAWDVIEAEAIIDEFPTSCFTGFVLVSLGICIGQLIHPEFYGKLANGFMSMTWQTLASKISGIRTLMAMVS